MSKSASGASTDSNAEKMPLGGTWWKVEKWNDFPKPVTVTRSTTHRVWYMDGLKRERFESRDCEYHNYFQTEDEAVSALRKRFNAKINNAKETIAENGRKLAALTEKYGVPA